MRIIPWNAQPGWWAARRSLWVWPQRPGMPAVGLTLPGCRAAAAIRRRTTARSNRCAAIFVADVPGDEGWVFNEYRSAGRRASPAEAGGVGVRAEGMPAAVMKPGGTHPRRTSVLRRARRERMRWRLPLHRTRTPPGGVSQPQQPVQPFRA